AHWSATAQAHPAGEPGIATPDSRSVLDTCDDATVDARRHELALSSALLSGLHDVREEIDHRSVERARLLEEGAVRCVLDHLQARAGDVLVQVRRIPCGHGHVLISGNDEGGHVD